MPHVLLVDDDAELTRWLADYLVCEGFEVRVAHDGEAGVRSALQEPCDIVVLDIMLPKVTGIEALRRIRAGSEVPVVMLTARGDNIDRIVGLEMGADDYVPKPCSPGELVARLRAILRRTQSREQGPALTHPDVLTAGELCLWPGKRTARLRDAPLELTGTEFNVLAVLTRQAGQLVSKQDISQQVFGQPLNRYDRRIDVHVSSVRQKLGPRADGQSWIQSVRGLGYQLLRD
ncbi:MAG: hypothetical protein RLZZ182_2400 [Pseudomonadota bacterium]|jgi:DNA-binding response OmpR family regulator